jgi:hypothetical protein
VEDMNLEALLATLSNERTLRERIVAVRVGQKWHDIPPANQALTRFDHNELFTGLCIIFTIEPGSEYIIPVRKVTALRVIPED